MIFWNAGGLGWSIGKTQFLSSGSFWHRSGLDTAEPWQGDWDSDVEVKCATLQPIDCLWSGFSDWSECSSSCGEGVQTRSRKILQPAESGGNECTGKEREERICIMKPCKGKTGNVI